MLDERRAGKSNHTKYVYFAVPVGKLTSWGSPLKP